jgi:hypothetical protein
VLSFGADFALTATGAKWVTSAKTAGGVTVRSSAAGAFYGAASEITGMGAEALGGAEIVRTAAIRIRNGAAMGAA